MFRAVVEVRRFVSAFDRLCGSARFYAGNRLINCGKGLLPFQVGDVFLTDIFNVLLTWTRFVCGFGRQTFGTFFSANCLLWALNFGLLESYLTVELFHVVLFCGCCFELDQTLKRVRVR